MRTHDDVVQPGDLKLRRGDIVEKLFHLRYTPEKNQQAQQNPRDPGADKFVTSNPLTGSRTFDAASWASYLATGASWAQASWSDASWAEASWNEASWAEASWNAASWSCSVDSMMSSTASYSESTFSP